MTKRTDNFRDTIATVDADGKRRWVYPKRPNGRFYQWRTYLSYLLLLILFGLPWIRVGGEPIFMFNVLERHFILFGLNFTPQDFHLFAIVMITAVVFIALFTVVFGRLFCGWVCPQTIFMEMIFRKIEYWVEGNANQQRKLDKADWTTEKIRKKILKHGLFLIVSALIAHTFLAYIIGIDEVLATVSQSPVNNPGGFAAIVIFIGVFYFVFSRMREQVCIAICPYGRLQGVLLDSNSINVIYDYERGEPRGKIRKGQPKKSSCSDCENCRDGKDTCSDQILNRMEEAIRKGKPVVTKPINEPVLSITSDGIVLTDHGSVVSSPASTSEPGLAKASPATPPVKTKGDCIDCTLCVQVCPTGIDIRHGVQLECVNCTACIDACDTVMDKIDRPRGLIRYDSENGVARGERKLFTGRVIAYSTVLAALLALNIFLLGGRSGLDVILLRTPGQLYQEQADGALSNLYTFQLVNKTGKDKELVFRLTDVDGDLRFVSQQPVARSGEVTEGVVFIELRPDESGRFPDKINLEVLHEGEVLKSLTTSFIHPK